jgi:glycosyltransferase involved in cell wall biosynthesis
MAHWQTLVDCPDRIRYHRVKHQGAAAARNAGIECSRGDLIAFTDIDCVADSGWLAALNTTFQAHELDAVGGLTLSYSLSTRVERYCDYFGSLRTPIFQEGRVAFLIAANSCWRAEVLKRLAGFHAEYRRYAERGVIVIGFEDFDLSRRARAGGFQLGFAPEAIVFHQHRTHLSARLRQLYRYGAGGAFYQHLSPEQIPGRYQLPYPARTSHVLAAVGRELGRLWLAPFSYQDPQICFDQRLLYPVFDVLQRFAFYAGFYLMSTRLSKMHHAAKYQDIQNANPPGISSIREEELSRPTVGCPQSGQVEFGSTPSI